MLCYVKFNGIISLTKTQMEIHMNLLQFDRFDMLKKPIRQRHFLRPITWLISYPAVWAHRSKITKIGMQGLKPPYLLLCNHNSFFDFKVMTAALFPHRANYLVAIDGFIGREWLMRNVGCICKRKFTSDTVMVRHMKRVAENGDVVVLYPEARYSLCGTNAVLPESLGKLAKLLKIPVVTLIMHGHHVNSPFWNIKNRKVKHTEAVLTQLVTKDEIEKLDYKEINARIDTIFKYDDFAWQKDRNVRISYHDRAKGLHKVLYQCPNCHTEYRMASEGSKLWCNSCNKQWEMSEYGELSALNGKTEFTHIPDWYEWERSQVRNEIERGAYRFESDVTVDSLPNAKGFINLGKGKLIHDINGFLLEGEYEGTPYSVSINSKALYSCHIEYNYLGNRGDCVDLFPKGEDFSVTKIALATEEIYNLLRSGYNINPHKTEQLG
jgi:1-acyl-sn-glycerol-3-phosphate acyltransferase/ribosomal protein L37AE/L43A